MQNNINYSTLHEKKNPILIKYIYQGGGGYYKKGVEECLQFDYSFGLNKDPHDKQKGMLIAQTKY